MTDLCSDGTLAHHWVFPPPNGPHVTGTCLRCGAVRNEATSFHRDMVVGWKEKHAERLQRYEESAILPE